MGVGRLRKPWFEDRLASGASGQGAARSYRSALTSARITLRGMRWCRMFRRSPLDWITSKAQPSRRRSKAWAKAPSRRQRDVIAILRDPAIREKTPAEKNLGHRQHDGASRRA